MSINSDSPKTIALLGVPIEVGAAQRGTLMGPAALRTAGIAELWQSLGYKVEDHGDISRRDLSFIGESPPDNARHYREIKGWIAETSKRAYAMAKTGAIPVFLGGDHSLSMGSVNGVAKHWKEQNRELHVLWLDAHADYNTPQTTITTCMECRGLFYAASRGSTDLCRRTSGRQSRRDSSAYSDCARWTDWKKSCCRSAMFGFPTCGVSMSSA